MSEKYEETCGKGKLQQWVRSKCIKAEDGGKVTLRTALQRLQGGEEERVALTVERLRESRPWKPPSSPMEE